MKKTTKQGVVNKKVDQRTAVVETFVMRTHPIYKKQFKVVRRFLSDDKDNKYKEGDVVIIQECNPISKRKYFEIIKKVGSTIVGDEKIEGEEVLGAERKEEETTDKDAENS